MRRFPNDFGDSLGSRMKHPVRSRGFKVAQEGSLVHQDRAFRCKTDSRATEWRETSPKLRVDNLVPGIICNDREENRNGHHQKNLYNSELSAQEARTNYRRPLIDLNRARTKNTRSWQLSKDERSFLVRTIPPSFGIIFFTTQVALQLLITPNYTTLGGAASVPLDRRLLRDSDETSFYDSHNAFRSMSPSLSSDHSMGLQERLLRANEQTQSMGPKSYASERGSFGEPMDNNRNDDDDSDSVDGADLEDRTESETSGLEVSEANRGQPDDLGPQYQDRMSMGDQYGHKHRRDDSSELISRHNAQVGALQDILERRQLLASTIRPSAVQKQHSNTPIQSSQELSPISIGLDPSVPFSLGNPFSAFGGHPGADQDSPLGHAQMVPPQQSPNIVNPHKPQISNADNLDSTLPFGLNPLPHLFGFQGTGNSNLVSGPTGGSVFDGPQRGDQSAHMNQHTPAPSNDSESPSGQKVWPKIFRFTDGRINLSDFEKQKKIRLSNKSNQQASGSDNHIESAPIMFDGRQLKRKSFLILHGGIFSRR